MKRVTRMPLQERYSFLVKFYDEQGDLWGVYVWALNEREAISQVEYRYGKVKIKEVVEKLTGAI